MNFKNQILNLNVAQRGAIGEYLYHECVPESVEHHADGCDFLTYGERVDVKTTKRFINVNRPTSGKLDIASPKDENEIRANVILYKDCVSVHYDGISIGVFSWNWFESFVKGLPKWNTWKNGTKKRTARVSRKTESKGIPANRALTIDVMLSVYDFLIERCITRDKWMCLNKSERIALIFEGHFPIDAESLAWSVSVGLCIVFGPKEVSRRNLVERLAACERGFISPKQLMQSISKQIVKGTR